MNLPSNGTISLADILPPERVILLESNTKHEILNALIDVLGRAPGITDLEDMRTELFRREEMMSTGIGLGIAVPHVRAASIQGISMAVGISPRVVTDYDSLDGEPVHLVCMIAANIDQHTEYIRTLALVSRRLRNRDLFRSIITTDDPAIAHRLLVGESE